jgi:hypothetical protein
MHHLGRIVAMLFIFSVTTIAWLVLGGITWDRSNSQSNQLSSEVSDLWGRPLVQSAPAIRVEWTELTSRDETETDAQGRSRVKRVTEQVLRDEALSPSSSDLVVDIEEDIRRKGLVWFPLYDLAFAGAWTVRTTRAGHLVVPWELPDPNGVYDDLEIRVDGVPQPVILAPGASRADVRVPVNADEDHLVQVRFRTRGSSAFQYAPTAGVGELNDFRLVMTTDFSEIDYPEGTMSPSEVERAGDGHKLTWSFVHTISGKQIGMVVPTPIQPGELASALSMSAPISLGLFMVWIHILGLVKRIDVHPMHHAFMAAAFFAFHLLFAYSADHLPVEAAFALSSVTSVFLVTSYLGRVVSPRFALFEAGLAQTVYLVGFALAHFWDGFTGLTVTVIGIATLFAVMQLTSHVQWTAVFGGDEPARA